ncbi:MAG: hypothetical protein M3350_00795, partial [Actinomycetota bacterium]|nr:hypothetical protein [Actinomycetota bacterium]
MAAVTVLVTAAALAVTLSSTKEYDATSKLLLRDDEPIDALSDRAAVPADPERETNTKVALIKLETVADRVRGALGLQVSAEQLLQQVTTEVEGTSDIVLITARDGDPSRAAAIASRLASEYVAFRRQSARASIDEAAKLARSRLESLPPEQRASEEGRQLEGRLRELEIAASLQTGGAEVVRQASVPTSASTPRPLLSGVLAAFLGMALAVALALLLEFIDRRIRDEDEAQAVFQLPVLATIPRPSRGAGGSGVQGDQYQQEAYGTLAANVLFSNRGRELTALLITSPGSGDGKTSSVFGLARALTLLGQSVIAIEADLRHPRFVQICNLQQQGGLSSVLAGVGQLDDELVDVDAWTLGERSEEGRKRGAFFSVLPAGPVPPTASGMLSRPAMGDVMADCRRRADIVLVDSAPVGLVHDPITLVNVVDATILVSRLNWTTRDPA